MGPGGQAQLQPASPLPLINQPRTQSIVSVKCKNIAQSLRKAGTSLRMLRYGHIATHAALRQVYMWTAWKGALSPRVPCLRCMHFRGP